VYNFVDFLVSAKLRDLSVFSCNDYENGTEKLHHSPFCDVRK